MASCMKRTLKQAVVVIVGASSGIGRATALAFASRGAWLVLAARREALLRALADDCERAGGRALAVPTDVTDAQAVQRLAQVAAGAYGGRIDIWINNAGVGAVGEFTAVPIATHEQVIRTNLLGHLYGAHAVLPHFKRLGRGVLINTVSVGGWAPLPYAVAYSASKVGLRGYSEALRGELSGWPHIHVCDVFPAFIDTPGFQHSANYIGRELKPMPPVYPAERVARAMVALAVRPRAAVSVGSTAILARVLHALSGRLYAMASARFLRSYFARAPAAAIGDGAVFEPQQQEGTVSGGWSLRGGVGLRP
jgi:short-subunit dehydrogenase